MFIISLTYKVSLQQIDKELNNHVRYLKAQYAAGNFLASGRKVPRTGGVILSQMKDRIELENGNEYTGALEYKDSMYGLLYVTQKP